MKGILIAAAILARSAAALPTLEFSHSEPEGNVFHIRDDDTTYDTNVILGDQTVSYGQQEVGPTVQAALGPACTTKSGTCDTAGENADSLNQPTKFYKDAVSEPADGKVTFTIGTDEFGANMGGNLVAAMAAVGNHVQTSKQKSWTAPCTSLGCDKGLPSPNKPVTNTYYYGPATYNFKRYVKGTGAPVDSLTVTVSMSISDSEDATWCDVAEGASALAGALSGPLAAVFGLLSLAAC